MTDPVAGFTERFFGITGAGSRPGVDDALRVARGVVSQVIWLGRASFRSPADFDSAFKREGFRLVRNESFGPTHPDARQVTYESPDRMVVIKVKTMGYPDGRRIGGTMSVEITNGRGSDWKDVVCKVDHAGQPIPSNVITPDKVVQTVNGPRVVRATGRVEEIMDHEMVLDEASGVDENAFANRGHFDFLPGFNPRGAGNLRS